MSENLYFPAYFRDWNAIRYAVTPEQGWMLFTLCLDYAAGETPQMCSDPVIAAFFKLLSGGIERSKLAQVEKSAKRRYARYCGLVKNAGQEPLSFDEWEASAEGCEHLSTPVDKCDNPIEIQSKSNRNQESKKADKPRRSARFTPPSLEEVEAYCKERGNNVDARRFVDFYAAKGWKIGKETMKDWRAAVRTWERRQQNAGNDFGHGADAAPYPSIGGITRL